MTLSRTEAETINGIEANIIVPMNAISVTATTPDLTRAPRLEDGQRHKERRTRPDITSEQMTGLCRGEAIREHSSHAMQPR